MIQTNMLKGKQIVMGLEIYGKEAYTEKHVKARKKKKELGFSG